MHVQRIDQIKPTKIVIPKLSSKPPTSKPRLKNDPQQTPTISKPCLNIEENLINEVIPV